MICPSPTYVWVYVGVFDIFRICRNYIEDDDVDNGEYWIMKYNTSTYCTISTVPFSVMFEHLPSNADLNNSKIHVKKTNRLCLIVRHLSSCVR